MEHTISKGAKQNLLSYAGVSFLLLLALAQCKKNESVGRLDVIRGQLKSTPWKLRSSTADGIDQTASFTGFTLSFTPTSFTTTNGGPVWPAAGTWKFRDDDGRFITLTGIGDVEIESVTGAELILGFVHDSTTFGPGRKQSIKGVYRFDLVK
jgi:hypothetical protein